MTKITFRREGDRLFMSTEEEEVSFLPSEYAAWIDRLTAKGASLETSDPSLARSFTALTYLAVEAVNGLSDGDEVDVPVPSGKLLE
jgi:hypothetical protein